MPNECPKLRAKPSRRCKRRNERAEEENPISGRKPCSPLSDTRLKLLGLDEGLQLGAEDPVPELAGDAEAELVVEEVVLEMVLLQLLVPQRKVLVVQEVVRHVVADVAKDAPTVHGSAGIPVVAEDGLSQLPERRGQDNE